jgi:hypothetical protein
MIGQRRIVPGRFRVAEQEELAGHVSISAKATLHDYHQSARPKRPAIAEFPVSFTSK